MRNFLRIPLTLTAIGLLAACGSAIKLDDTPVESRVPVLVGSDSASAGGSASRAAGPGPGAGAGGLGATSRGAGGPGSGVGAGGAGGMAGSGSMAGAGGAGGAGTGGAWGAPGAAGAAGAGGAGGVGAAAGQGSAGWGSGGAGGSTTSAGTALPSAVGDSRLASISTVTPPPVAPRDDPAVLPPGMGRIVYFDFDSFVIRNDARPVIESHARVLTADRSRRMVIEGHTDERGGREYNLALGQKRAEAVLRALVMLGASDAQLEAVSFGKERPALQGSDEAAWAQNRRAELKDRR